ncbi:MAG TPA: penicillin-binding protein 2 [Tepidisphaeraceae bacterium]|nr:penicillin-binding protein 2 [Tepidisphaeraceae bacterium]
MPSFSTPRAGSVLGVIVALFVLLCGRVAWLQTYGSERTILRADRQQHLDVTLQARRGEIFDCNGILMAGSVQTHTLFVDPKFMAEEFDRNGLGKAGMDAAIQKLADLIDRDPDDLHKLLAADAGKRYVKLADDLDSDACDEIDQLDLPGVGVVPTSRRVYPMGSIACHLLGGVGGDGSGIEGLELQYDKILSGRDGFERLTKDARRRPIGLSADDYLPPDHGQHLVLTVDSNLQMFAEEELNDACESHKAKRGEVILMDPKTGGILAMANWMAGYPSFNPANLNDSPQDARRNRAITDPYEPGSTFKPFIAGPALMWGVTRPDEVWPVHGDHYIAPDGRHVTDVESYSNICTWDGLVKSSNILMSMLGERMGNPRLYAAITRFGFGRVTGIDLPGENPGKVNPLNKWGRFSTESVSQGYEVMVTPLQLARAFCAIANGGRLVQPHLLHGTLDANGDVLSKSSEADFDSLPRVLDPMTVVKLRRILCDVVIRGTARGCRSTIWNISGKTGTSYISEGKSGYSRTRYNSSFMACAPAEDPKLVVVLIVHEPDPATGHFGGAVAAPSACKLLERALTYLDVPPSPALPQPPPEIAAKLWEFQANQISDRSYGSKPVAE